MSLFLSIFAIILAIVCAIASSLFATALALCSCVLGFLYGSFFIVARFLFLMHLRRKDKAHWSRDCSSTNPEILDMYNEGLAWSEQNADHKKDVHIVNDGLNLYGEYYDYGHDRAVIFVPGRTEGLRYGYYFVQQYPAAGFNVLLIDPRAHGESDGEYNTIGFEEHKDLIAWAKLLHDEYGIKSIIFHGICIGSSSSLMALTADETPDYLDGLIAEGMYPTFYESFKNHMAEYNAPVRLTMPMVAWWMKRFNGYDMRKGNIHIIDKLEKPLLMIHSREDAYSLPSDAQLLYDKCASEQKRLVWFEKGAHSKLRITDPALYTSAIDQFLTDYFPVEKVS